MNDLMKVPEVAEFLRCQPRTIYKWIKNNRLPYYKLGASLLFRREDVLRWMDERKIDGKSKFPKTAA